MRKTHYLLTRAGVLAMLVLLVACQKSEPQGPMTTLPVEVGVIELEKKTVPLQYELSGRIHALHQAEIRPQVGGVLQQRLYKEGDVVSVGQALYQIDDALLKAEVQSAEAALKRAEASLKAVAPQAKRYAELVKIKAVSVQENEQVQAQWLQAQAEVVAAKAALNRIKTEWNYTVVKSPIAGVAGISAVTEGALLSPSQTQALTTVQAIDEVYVDMNQSTAQWFAMQEALQQTETTPTINVELALENGSTYEHRGTVTFSAVQVDPTSSTVHIRALFPNPNRVLLPGMYVQTTIKGAQQDAYVVPQQAVQRDAQGNASVWVVNSEQQAQIQPVEVWRALGNQWVISPNTLENKTIVVEGVQKLRPTMPVRTRTAQLDSTTEVN